MRSLTTPVTTQLAAPESGWVELVDIYLREPILTPFGTLSTIRLTTHPDGFIFFTPTLSPEPSATQGDAATYSFWPLKRKTVSSGTKFADKKMVLAASNVSGEWAGMLSLIQWQDLYIVIRSVSTTITAPTADDCAILFIGQIDSCKVTLEQVQIVASSSLGNFTTTLPAEDMHASCRFRWADDQCTALRHRLENARFLTLNTGCSTTRLLAADQLYNAESVTLNPDSWHVLLTAHGLTNGDLVQLGGTLPTELTAGRWYYVIEADLDPDQFKLAASFGGSAIPFSTGGASVTLTTRPGLDESGLENDYGTDLINALADGDITESSYQSAYHGYSVKSGKPAADHWRFLDSLTATAPSLNIFSPHIRIDFGSSQSIAAFRITNGPDADPDRPAQRSFAVYKSDDDATWDYIASTSYYGGAGTTIANETLVRIPVYSARYWRIVIQRVDRSALLNAVVGKIYAYDSATSTTDLVDPLANGAFTASSEKTGNEAYRVQSSASGYWALDTSLTIEDLGSSDWGIPEQGYWRIPDDQSGLANALLTPWIQFDFGSAKNPRVWRIKSRDNVDREDIPRLLVIFSSPDATTWTHEGYFEFPPQSGITCDWLIPTAHSARYWRICVRTTWSESISYSMMNKVWAYEGGRNYWAHGQIRFTDDTATVALRGLAVPVLTSFAGGLTCRPLPVAPAAGDRLFLTRGCPRHFNACSERQNWENFGGFDSLPQETVAR